MSQPEICEFKCKRFINHALSEFYDINRSPIDGYQQLPVLSLEESTKELISRVPDLQKSISIAKEKCNRNSSLLTWDESAAIYLYSMPTSFFSELNKGLRNENRDTLKPWFAYLKTIYTCSGKVAFT